MENPLFIFHLRHAAPSMSGDEDDAQEDRRKIGSTMENPFLCKDAVGCHPFYFLKDSGNPRKVNFPERIFLGSSMENRFFSSGFLQES